MNTGETIGILAKQRGFNLRQLANKAGIPYNTLYAIVKRKSSRIEGSTLRRIANALDVSIDDLEPFTPRLMHLNMDDSWTIGPRFESVITSRMIDAESREDRNAAKGDVQQLLKAFDLLNESGQKKAIEMLTVLTEVPAYLNPSAVQQRRPAKEIADQIFAEYADIQAAENEASLYELIDRLLAAHDAADEEKSLLAMDFLIFQHQGGKEVSDDDLTRLCAQLQSILAAHDDGREQDEQRLIMEFVDTAV